MQVGGADGAGDDGVDEKIEHAFEKAEKVFQLLASESTVKSDSEPVVRKPALVKAHNGDFKLFAKLDPDDTGICNHDSWMSYTRETLEQKEGKGRGKGANWLHMLMDTLKRGCKSDAQLKAEAAARRAVVAQLFRTVKDVWYLLLKKHETTALEKKDLEEAMSAASPEVADPDLFDKIDGDGDGIVKMSEFTTYFNDTRSDGGE